MYEFNIYNHLTRAKVLKTYKKSNVRDETYAAHYGFINLSIMEYQILSLGIHINHNGIVAVYLLGEDVL